MPAATNAASPTGRLIKKIHLQLEVSISQPPRIGPAIGASSIGMLKIDINRPRRPGPASRVMIMNPSGISMPPLMPCTTRNMMSCKMVDAIAHSSEPSTNATTEPMKRRLVPNRSAAHPVSGMTVANPSV